MKIKFRIRRFKPGDEDDVTAYINRDMSLGLFSEASIDEPISEEKKAKNREIYSGKERTSLVAVLGGRVIGEAGYYKRSGRNSYTGDCGWSIDSRFRSQGVASALLAVLIEHALASGMHRLEAYVAVSNKDSCKLAEKFFVLEGVKKEAFRRDSGEFIDVNLYGRVLN